MPSALPHQGVLLRPEPGSQVAQAQLHIPDAVTGQDLQRLKRHPLASRPPPGALQQQGDLGRGLAGLALLAAAAAAPAGGGACRDVKACGVGGVSGEAWAWHSAPGG